MIWRNIILAFFLLSRLTVFAQAENGKTFTHYTTADGLTHNTVTQLAQDSTGFMWIGTAQGLNRFDGRHFLQYLSNDDRYSLPSDEVNGMAWLDRHRLGVFTTGLHIVDTRNGGATNLFVPYHLKKYQFKFNMLVRAKGDARGHVYLLTRSGFYHFDDKGKLLYRFDHFTEAEVELHHFHYGTEMLDLDNNRLLIVSVDGLFIYNKATKTYKRMQAGDETLLDPFLSLRHERSTIFYQVREGVFFAFRPAKDSVYFINLPQKKRVGSVAGIPSINTEVSWRSSMLKISESSFYLTGHISGYYRFTVDAEGKVHCDTTKRFAAYLCNRLFIDRENRLWVATNRGLFCEKAARPSIRIASLPTGIEKEYPNIRVNAVYTKDDELLAATQTGGLLVFDQQSGAVKKQLSLGGPNENMVRVMEPAGDDKLLLGTSGDLLLYDRRSNKISALHPPEYETGDWVNDLETDRDKKIWISSHRIYLYDPASAKFTIMPSFPRLLDVPSSIKEDGDGNIWMARHGLVRFNRKKNSYDLYIDSFPFIKMPDKQIGVMEIDAQNRVWFNAANNGLICYDIPTGAFRHFTTKDGLPENNISAMKIIGNKLWMACFSGIACLDLQKMEIVSFSTEDGFPNEPVARGSRFYYDSLNNRISIGFTSAIAQFNPDSILFRRAPPKLFVENISINGRDQHYLPGANFQINWKQDELLFTIGTINYNDASPQHFAYRIVRGDDSPWVDIGSQSSFSISNLPPGMHRLQVRSYSPKNRWPAQVREMTVEVLPPFWRKGWFLVMAILVLLGLIFLIVRSQVSRIRRKEEEKTHVEKLKADHYKNQYELEQITNYFTSSLAGMHDREAVLWDVAQNLIGKLNYEDCMIYLWNSDKTRMVQKAAWGPKGKPELIETDLFEVNPGQGVVGHVVATKQPYLVMDTRLEPRYRVDDNFRLSEVTVPIIHNDELLGVIDSESSVVGYYSERDVNILTTIASLLANKLLQMDSERSLAAKQQEIAGINEQLAEARLSALQAQMNPHFVFNALNSIKRMILDGDNDTASRYLSKFALMIRMTLEHSKQIFVTLDDNIEYISAYLDMEKLRFDDSFTYEIRVDEAVDGSEAVIPSMMIQPLVENAIWHGLMQSAGDKQIRVCFGLSADHLVCTVEDNGIGIRNAEKLKARQRPFHRSVGLENLQKRIHIMNEKYGTDCSLQLTDLEDEGRKGTRVKLQLKHLNL